MRLPHLAILCLLLLVPSPALALIEGGEGNTPINDPGWPAGAAAIFNHEGRVAYWVGPPFGGGQWHAECRGDAKALSAVLADFAKLEVKTKRLIVHDGAGHSFWLNPNRNAEKKDDAKIDWTFMVWQPASWEHLKTLPGELNPIDPRDADKGPPVQIDVYAGGLKWTDVKVPKGLEVTDNRLEAHGYKVSDGNVLEGQVIDLATKKPLAAKMKLELVEPQKKGGYVYKKVAEATTDKDGKWVLKSAPIGWHRVVVEHEGYVPRVLGYGQYEEGPRWHKYDGGLAKAAEVSGQVTDDEKKPLADVDVRLSGVMVAGAGRYDSAREYTTKTDADGRFRLESVPAGNGTLWIHKVGYVRPGLGPKIEAPAKDVALKMMKSAKVTVTIGFGAKVRPDGYIVSIKPAEGEAIGKWGGSGNIDAKNQMTFSDVPPGAYVLTGRPNPGSDKEETDPLTVVLKGGEAMTVTITAK